MGVVSSSIVSTNLATSTRGNGRERRSCTATATWPSTTRYVHATERDLMAAVAALPVERAEAGEAAAAFPRVTGARRETNEPARRQYGSLATTGGKVAMEDGRFLYRPPAGWPGCPPLLFPGGGRDRADGDQSRVRAGRGLPRSPGVPRRRERADDPPATGRASRIRADVPGTRR